MFGVFHLLVVSNRKRTYHIYVFFILKKNKKRNHCFQCWKQRNKHTCVLEGKHRIWRWEGESCCMWGEERTLTLCVNKSSFSQSIENFLSLYSNYRYNRLLLQIVAAAAAIVCLLLELKGNLILYTLILQTISMWIFCPKNWMLN